MSCRIAARRLALLRPSPSSPWVPAARRAYASTNGDKPAPAPSHDEQDLSNPLLEKYLERKERENRALDSDAKDPRPMPRFGAMSKHLSTIFTPEAAIPGWRDDLAPEEKAALKAKAEARKKEVDTANELKLSEMTLDPDKRARRRLERRFVIKDVKRRGRMNKAQTLARTERQSLYRSHDLPASTKKLQKVMNQVAGKTVDEALVQLRFSKKKIARDVIKGIEIARNEAIIARGMGLGSGAGARKRWQAQRDDATLSGADPATAKTGERERLSKPAKIELKDGSKKMVRDPTEIYIDQAWVSKGIMTKSAEFRARGRVNTIRHRSTSFSVLLKEEKTRMRISEEIKKKRDNRKLWVALPDRPVTAQRQYCLW